MSKVPLIPFRRPEPQVFQKRDKPADTKPKAKKAKKKKGVGMGATNKKQKKPVFQASNSEDIGTKPKAVQRLWKILSKMDEEGTLFVNDEGIVGFDGEYPEERSPEALGLTAQEVKLLRPWAVFDGPEPDDQETATGVILTTYQLVELAYAMGKQAEHTSTTRALTEAAEPVEEDGEEEDEEEWDPDDDEEDGEEGEEEEEEDEEMEVIDEDEYDEEED